MNNYYDTLGVTPQASTTEIKASYRQLAKVFHPDMDGGDAIRFAFIKEAYEVLSTPHRRNWYDKQARSAKAKPHKRPVNKPTAPKSTAQPFRQRASNQYTRIMSIAIARSGRFAIDRFSGTIAIQPTTPDNLWRTTLRKFGGQDRWRLSRHIIQIKVTGDRDLVRAVYPTATETGVSVERQSRNGDAEMFARGFNGSKRRQENVFMSGGINGRMGSVANPLHIQATVPKGIGLQFDDIEGTIDIGNQEAELIAKLQKSNILRAGRLSRASLILTDSSRAHIANIDGNADIMAMDRSRTLLNGQFERFRSVIENQGHVEVQGSIDTLIAEVRGMGYLNAKNIVHDAHLDIGGNGYVQIAKLLSSLQGTRSGNGKVKVLSRQFRIPFLRRFATRGYDG